MFSDIRSYTDVEGHTTARLFLEEEGLKVVVHFYSYEPSFPDPVLHGVQVLSRVYAVPPRKMKGRKPGTWSDSLRYDVVAAEQHLPVPRQTDCSSNH